MLKKLALLNPILAGFFKLNLHVCLCCSFAVVKFEVNAFKPEPLYSTTIRLKRYKTRFSWGITWGAPTLWWIPLPWPLWCQPWTHQINKNGSIPREWGCQIVNSANKSSFVTVSHKGDYENYVCKNLSDVLLLNLSTAARPYRTCIGDNANILRRAKSDHVHCYMQATVRVVLDTL